VTCGVAASPDGKKVYVTDYPNALKMYDTTTNTVTTLVSSGLTNPFAVAVSPVIARQQTPAPYDGFLYIDFIGTSGTPTGKFYISPDSTNPKSPGHVELGIDNGGLVAPIKQGMYCFMISTARPENYRLYYQPLVPQGADAELATGSEDQSLISIEDQAEIPPGQKSPDISPPESTKVKPLAVYPG
jgi:YVTN family beta-propeller protein